jgi:hypothetical protein
MKQLSIASKHAIRQVSFRSLISLESGITFLLCVSGALTQAPPVLFLTDVSAIIAGKEAIHLLQADLHHLSRQGDGVG